MQRTIILIIFSIALAFTIYYLHKVFEIDYTVPRKLHFYGCEVTYKYSYTDFYFSNKKTNGHSSNNWRQIEYAKHKVMDCLCDKYIQSKDTLIANVIIDFYFKDGPAQSHYIFNVLHGFDTKTKPSIDTICKYKDIIFDFSPIIME